MEPFTVLVRDGCHISREKIQVGLQEMEFPRHVAPKGKVREKQVLHDFYVIFSFSYFPKDAALFFKRVPDSSLRSIQFIFEVGSWKSCLT
jgi:hypothetical protein